MPSDERESPRAAIRNWLHITETKSPKPRHIQAEEQREQHQHGSKARHRSRKQNPRTKDIERQHVARTRTQDVDHGGDRKTGSCRDAVEDSEHEPARGNKSKSNEARNHGHTKRHTLQRPDEPSLAEKLGLHAPFRTFRDRSEDEDVNLDALNRPRKRRRRRSSTGSYLEPAEIEEQIDLERDAGSPSKEAINGGSRRIHLRSRAEHRSDSSVATPPLPEKPAESYVRRPRHKTRDDRYELKEGNGDRRKKKSKLDEREGKDKKLKKHKRKAKLGEAIMHDFSAQNVSHDRLTLQPAKPLGLFGRGRASSPIRRKGLPDLAFSEMSFLNSRRPKPAEIATHSVIRPAEMTKRRKSTQAVDTEAEISRYFTSKKAPDQDGTDRPCAPKQRDSHRRSRNRDSPPDFVDLPGTPFLGFGSCGAASASPAKQLGSPALRDLERRLTRSPTRSTSYLTWSQSGAPSQGSSRLVKDKVMPMASSRCLNPVSREADSSGLALSSSHVEKDLFEKHCTRISVTPERNARSRSGNFQGPSPQPKARKSGGIEERNQDQDSDKTGQHSEQESQRSVEDTSQRVQADTSPHLHHGNSVSPPAGGILATRNEPNAKAIANPRHSDMRVQGGINPLDTALEALLRDARPADREVEEAVPGTTDSVLKHTKNVEITPAGQTRYNPRTSSSGHGVLPLAESGWEHKHSIIAGGPHIRYDMPYSRPGHDMELSRTQRSRHSTPGPNSHIASRPRCGDYMPELLLSPHGTRVDSRSAWNGYGDIYERQQLETPTAINHYQYLADHNGVNDGDYGMPNDSLSPPRQHPARYLDDHTGSAFYERHGLLPPVNSRIEEEAYLHDSTWGDTGENIFAEHDTAFPAERFAHSYEDRHQGYDRFQQLQYRTEPTTVTRRPAILSSTPIMEEVAPSGFWTPHKLY